MSRNRPPLAAYRDELAASLQRSLVPFTAPYGRELTFTPDILLVEPWLVPFDSAAATTDLPAKDEHHDDAVHGNERDRLWPLLIRHGATGLVVLGEPGSGKSTLARRLATTITTHTPIFLPVTAFATQLASNSRASLADLAAAHWQTQGISGLGPDFEAALSEGRAVIVLDGFDEAGHRSQRRSLAERIVADITRHPGNLWLLTSRPDGYEDAPLPAPATMIVELRPWEPEQTAAAITGWCRVLASEQPGKAPQPDPDIQRRAARLIDAIATDGSLAQLAHTPLNLALLVLVEYTRGELPSHRVRLYELFADEMLRRRRPESAPPHALEPEEFLIPLALWLHREHPVGHVPSDALADECTRIALGYEGYRRGEEASPDELTLAVARAREFFTADRSSAAGGILTATSPGVLAFASRALQDFYVGRALARLPADRRWELLRPRLHAPRWREPLLLCAGWLAAVERRREEVDSLCRQILDARSQYEALLARDARLAIAVAAQCGGLIRHQRLGEMFARMEDFTAAMPSSGSRVAWLRACVDLAHLGFGDAERVLRDSIENGFPALQRLSVTVLAGHLADSKAVPLRALAIRALDREDPDTRHTAWHLLLPLWSRATDVRDALLRAIRTDNLPPCSAGLHELARRALAATPEHLDWFAQHRRIAPWLVVARLEASEPVSDADIREAMIEDPHQAANLIADLLWSRHADSSVRMTVERLLRDPEPRIRALLLRHLPIGLSDFSPVYLEAGTNDDDANVRESALSKGLQVIFHQPAGLALAKILLDEPNAQKILASEVCSDWLNDPELRPRIFGLFSPDASMASDAFRCSFHRIFDRQPELVELAIRAFTSGAAEVRDAALEAMEPHLATVPQFTATLTATLAERQKPAEDRERVLLALRRVVDAVPAVQVAVCQLAADDHEGPELRRSAVSCLGHLAHHERLVWTTIRTVVEATDPTTKDLWSLVATAHGVLLRLANFLPGESLRRGIVYLDGRRTGVLEETTAGTRFTYDDAWLSSPEALPISLTMPLRAQPYETAGLHPFFDNMLPEGWLLERVSLAGKIDKRDRLGILLATGTDPIGAVSVFADENHEDDA